MGALVRVGNNSNTNCKIAKFYCLLQYDIWEITMLKYQNPDSADSVKRYNWSN